MSFFILCLLCVVQGFTEFLPVSSSGHLLLIEQLFGIKDDVLLINLFLHLATLLAVVIVYRKIIIKLIKKPFQSLTYKLLISTVITVIFALAYKFFNIQEIVTKIYGFCFFITSILVVPLDLILAFIFSRLVWISLLFLDIPNIFSHLSRPYVALST